MKSRNKIRIYRPMGEVKTVYYRKGGKLIKVGVLCLDCLLFEPAEKIRRPTFKPRVNTDIKKVY